MEPTAQTEQIDHAEPESEAGVERNAVAIMPLRSPESSTPSSSLTGQ